MVAFARSATTRNRFLRQEAPIHAIADVMYLKAMFPLPAEFSEAIAYQLKVNARVVLTWHAASSLLPLHFCRQMRFSRHSPSAKQRASCPCNTDQSETLAASEHSRYIAYECSLYLGRTRIDLRITRLRQGYQISLQKTEIICIHLGFRSSMPINNIRIQRKVKHSMILQLLIQYAICSSGF